MIFVANRLGKSFLFSCFGESVFEQLFFMCFALFSQCILASLVPPHCTNGLFFVYPHDIKATFHTILIEVMLDWYILLHLLGGWLNVFSFLHYSSYKEKTSRATMETMSWLVVWMVRWLVR